MRLTLAVLGLVVAACSSDGDSSSSSSSSSSSGSSSSSSSTSSTSSSGGSSGTTSTSSDGGTAADASDPKRATCEAYADLVVACCSPPVPQCAADRRDGWVDFCMKGYDSCSKAYDCLAKATCATKDSCPSFGTGCN